MLENKNNEQTPISEIGKVQLSDRLTKDFENVNKSTILSVGDDAGIIDIQKDYQVLSTETMVEGVHFDIVYTPLKHLGYKAVVTAISDIVAMNATATQIMVSFSASSKYPVEALDEIYSGVRTACNIYKVDLIGGDSTAAPNGLSITVTAIGKQAKDKIVYRKGAQHNDLLVVTGDLGAAYMGLLILEREKVTYEANPDFQPDLENYQYLIEKQLKPEARKDIISYFEEKKIKPTSMIDISDSMASELKHLSKQSNIGFHVYENKLPIDPSVLTTCSEFDINPTIAAMNGGEDYELMFTIDQKNYDTIKSDPNFTVVGFATDKSDKPYLITSGTEQLVEITAQGWN